MKLVLSLLKHSNPRAFEIQAKQIGFTDRDIKAATLFRVWRNEEFPTKSYELLDEEHRQISIKVKFKVEDFCPAMQRLGNKE